MNQKYIITFYSFISFQLPRLFPSLKRQQPKNKLNQSNRLISDEINNSYDYGLPTKRFPPLETSIIQSNINSILLIKQSNPKQQYSKYSKSDKKIIQEHEIKKIFYRPIKLQIRQTSADIIDKKHQQPDKFYFRIGFGNNDKLIKKLLLSRKIWFEQSTNIVPHFIWQQTSLGIQFDKINQYKQVVNHFEYHRELTTKTGLVANLQKYAPNKVFNILPLTFIVSLESNMEPEFLRFVNFFVQNSPNDLKKTDIKIYEANISYYCTKKNEKSQPKNPLFPQDSNYIWLLKPADFNRGNGIHIFNDFQTLESFLLQYYKGFHQNGNFIKCKKFVIQKYIEKPFLINGRKFDIRMWGLINHKMKGYMFQEGYIRTSSEIYNLDQDSLNNKFVHLTNNAIQKFNEKYGDFENGNQLSFECLDNYMIQNNKVGFYKKCMPQIEQHIINSFNSVKGKINKHHRKNCFELFGFDFMIDEQLKVWLIEVNSNPCLEQSSELLKRLIPQMIDGVLNLTIDKIFNNSMNEQEGWEHIGNF